jgi:hypothetical protein
MKSITLVLLLVAACNCGALGQSKKDEKYIMTVTTKTYKPVTITPSVKGGVADGVQLILDFLHDYAALKCLDKLNKSLEVQIAKAYEKYKAKFPKGTAPSFLVITNKYNCTALNIIPQPQTVRIEEGKCSINDIQVPETPIIYDPETTGFFVINIKF